MNINQKKNMMNNILVSGWIRSRSPSPPLNNTWTLSPGKRQQLAVNFCFFTC